MKIHTKENSEMIKNSTLVQLNVGTYTIENEYEFILWHL